MPEINYYDILGISETATPQQIQSAFRSLSKEHHPDKGGDPEVFQTIREAYETLSNPEKRAVYDYFDGQDINEVRTIVISIFKAALASSEQDVKSGITKASRDIRGRINEEIRGFSTEIKNHEKILKRIKRYPPGMDFLGDDIRGVIENIRSQKAESQRRLNVVKTAEKFLLDRYEFSESRRIPMPWEVK